MRDLAACCEATALALLQQQHQAAVSASTTTGRLACTRRGHGSASTGSDGPYLLAVDGVLLSQAQLVGGVARLLGHDQLE